jgi:hypothetical protein
MSSAVHGSLRSFLQLSLFQPNRLIANQQLVVNDQLVSNNELVNLIVQGDGNIVLYRTMFGVPLWASNTAGASVDHVIMQVDGNLVAYSPAGERVWATGTDRHTDAYCILQGDGDFVVYDSANNPLWASNTVQDYASPTFVYSDSNSYIYNETSESWKQLCQAFPCFDALQWPDYASTHIETRIMGQPVVIQLWKGWCQKFLGLSTFPGGVGAEVGVYRRIPGRIRPTSLPFLPKPLELLILGQLQALSDDDLWWPFPELGASVEYTLVNPITNETFFKGGPETTYWLAKWMFDDSYSRFQSAQGDDKTPTLSTGYVLRYSINGQSFLPW